MAENKKSFILYADYEEVFDELSDENAGQLIKHIFKYVNDKNPNTENPMVKISFIPIKKQLKRDLKIWEDERKKRSMAGIKGMESRWGKDKSVITEDKSVISAITPITDNVNVTVNVSDTVNDKDKKIKELSKNEKIFDFVRKKYPGSKKGLKTEYDNFKKKHKNYLAILELLLPAINKQIIWRQNSNGEFRPEWKNFQTWINQKEWEMELPIDENTKEEYTHFEAIEIDGTLRSFEKIPNKRTWRKV